MAYSYVRYTGNGSTTNFAFSFPYLNRDHIKVRVNDVITSFTFLNDSTVTVSPAPALGAVVEVRRETPKDSPIVNFTDGSVLLEADLDLLATYNLYVAQETDDTSSAALLENSLGVFDAENKRIANLAEPVNAQDAVTKAYADVQFVAATAAANAAANSATSAASSAAIATDKANLVSNIFDTISPNVVSFVGDGAETSFNLGFNPLNEENVDVYINGVWMPLSEFSISGTNIVFATAPALNAEIDIKASAGVQVTFSDSNEVVYAPTLAGSKSVQEKLQETVSIKDHGAVCDGVTNDTTAVQAAIAAIGGNNVSLIIPGPTKINTNLTFSPATQLVFQNGGRFIGTSGTEVITLQRAPVAGIQRLFQSCDPYATIAMTVYPEWFGAVKDGSTDDRAAFQAALRFLRNVGGLIQLQAGFYAISDRISIDYNNITIQGAGNNTSWIKVTGANKNGIVVNGVSGNAIRNVMLRDFSVILATVATSSCIGIYLYYTAFPIVERVQIHDFLIGVLMEGATNSQITKVGATYTGGATNGFVGFNIYGGASGASAANASSILRDCYASGTPGLTGQIGFRLYGSYMSDVQMDTCETALTNYGYYVDYSSAPNFNVDIIIRNPIIDRFYTQGILVTALPSNGILQIIGGYTNPDTLGYATQNLYLDGCVGAVNVVGHEFMALTNTIYTDGVYATNCTGLTVSGCVFSMLNKGVYMNACGYSVITGNVFRGGNPSSFSKMVEVIGGARVMVNGNSFDGATEAVTIDATSDGCGIVGNTANVATTATRFTNSGTNPVGGANGSTGLNSGI